MSPNELCLEIAKAIHVPSRYIEFDTSKYIYKCTCGLCDEAWTHEIVREAFVAEDEVEQRRLQGLMWYYHRTRIGGNIFILSNMMCYELGRRSGLLQACNDCTHRYKCITNSFILV